jgi:phosphatidylserine/phosphatidylglycerophosphate/cardiolipin synthase-like enzyme
MAHRSLVILPDDTIEPILDAIGAARQTLRIKMFVFSEPQLIDAVLAAFARGVRVRVMLNPSRSDGAELNQIARDLLNKAGIEVRDTSPAFKVSHEKSIVIDEHIAFIQSFNWATRHLTKTRDYAVITSHSKEVFEIISCFESDWARTEFNPEGAAHLIWCRGNGRARVARFIDEAKHSLIVQNDRYHDLVIIERLVRAANRGVKIHIMSPPLHTLKKDKLVEGIGGLRVMNDVGIKIHNHQHLEMHAKMLLADAKRAIVGSINLTTGSFDERRELAIEVTDENIIERLNHVAHHDWKHSYPLDLSDKGIYKDLENIAEEGSDKLALNFERKSKKDKYE